MKVSTAVQEGCGYKDTLRALRYFAPLAKYFTVCITYQPPLVRPTHYLSYRRVCGLRRVTAVTVQFNLLCDRREQYSVT